MIARMVTMTSPPIPFRGKSQIRAIQTWENEKPHPAEKHGNKRRRGGGGKGRTLVSVTRATAAALLSTRTDPLICRGATINSSSGVAHMFRYLPRLSTEAVGKIGEKLEPHIVLNKHASGFKPVLGILSFAH